MFKLPFLFLILVVNTKHLAMFVHWVHKDFSKFSSILRRLAHFVINWVVGYGRGDIAALNIIRHKFNVSPISWILNINFLVELKFDVIFCIVTRAIIEKLSIYSKLIIDQ